MAALGLGAYSSSDSDGEVEEEAQIATETLAQRVVDTAPGTAGAGDAPSI
jgi:hypothetical protein